MPELDSELSDLLAECSCSTKMCAKVFFPERFSAEFSPLHDEIFDAIDSGHPRVVIAAPRGIGKTSIVGLALTARSILFNLRRFICYVSMSHDNAALQTENLKMELVTNRIVRKLFGSVKARSINEEEDGIDESFSKKMWVALGRTLVLPRGSGQQIRGLLYRNSRPDLFVVDDLEDPDTIDSEEIRLKRKNWFFADLLKATSRVSKEWQIVYIDTLKHHDALLESLLGDPSWLPIRQEICNDELHSNAPSFISDEDLKKEYESHRIQGILDVFAREYRNRPISKEDAVFKPEFFKYHNEPELSMKPRIENVVIVDPAKTVKMHSADSAIIGIGIDTAGRSLFVRDIVSGKMHPDELLFEMFAMCDRLGSKVLGVEVTSLNEFITQPIKNEMLARGKFYELVELNPRGGNRKVTSKADRIAALVPYYRQGYISHNPACCHVLEQQLLEFPRPKRWDVMDALAYIIEMMELGGRYFDPPEMEDKDMEAEYDELKDSNEEPLRGRCLC